MGLLLQFPELSDKVTGPGVRRLAPPGPGSAPHGGKGPAVHPNGTVHIAGNADQNMAGPATPRGTVMRTLRVALSHVT